MADEVDAICTMAEGAMVSRAVEKKAGEAVQNHDSAACLNCGEMRTGAYCGNCGQSAHIHRSISAFWHDILHGVLHFEGKFWRTLPMLAWHPGKLTRRYIHGERARFISPMSLFLFAIFMMFAIFSFMPSGSDDKSAKEYLNSEEITVAAEKLDQQVAQATQKLADSGSMSAEERQELEDWITEWKIERNGISYIRTGEAKYPDVGSKIETSGVGISTGNGIESGWAALDNRVNNFIKKTRTNPDLILYKLKSDGYKFAWLLIPISIPFVWLVTLGVRGHRFYDHAVFTTYSLAFMSLMFIAVVLLGSFGIGTGFTVPFALGYGLFHLYRQLRHAYALSRPGALLRLIFLLISIVIALILFALILLVLGMLS